MAWLDWLHRGRAAAIPLDVEATLADGLRSVAAAEQAVAGLQRERKAAERERKALLARSKRVRPKQVRNMGRSNPNMPELAVYEVSQAMREANQTSQADMLRQAQLAAVEARLDAIYGALTQLDVSARKSDRRS